VIAAAAPPLPVDLVESLRRLRLATMREQAELMSDLVEIAGDARSEG
jgi:hypothetical protein